ncbi:hypothetical protein GALMADRAFT_810924 [Galerina marginata CBS 339.88]|uniref:Extracellular membrane protein CFEM domain-containing protein n=1 Tax=Galerina marginata (strain CBS 339.88) TaxID=685588 RepID=A0A067ST25_GALM3|nr:hypothetical protein GALMADRAFT_810924 [Galerina marginata CBS 339.88]
MLVVSFSVFYFTLVLLCCFTQVYVSGMPPPIQVYEVTTSVNYTILAVARHCVSRCEPVTRMMKTCATMDCICTERNFNSFGMCMSCAVESKSYHLPSHDAQSYVDNIVRSCHRAGHILAPPVIHFNPLAIHSDADSDHQAKFSPTSTNVIVVSLGVLVYGIIYLLRVSYRRLFCDGRPTDKSLASKDKDASSLSIK